jgi:hypothetical protein
LIVAREPWLAPRADGMAGKSSGLARHDKRQGVFVLHIDVQSGKCAMMRVFAHGA